MVRHSQLEAGASTRYSSGRLEVSVASLRRPKFPLVAHAYIIPDVLHFIDGMRRHNLALNAGALISG
jgi:hypothetical protein